MDEKIIGQEPAEEMPEAYAAVTAGVEAEPADIEAEPAGQNAAADAERIDAARPETVRDEAEEPEAEDEPPKKRTIKDRIKSIPVVSRVFFCIFFAALAIHLVSFASEGFADFFNLNVSSFFRMALSKLTGWLPFSLAETAVLALPAGLVVIFIYFFAVAMKKDRAGRFVIVMLSVVTMLYSVFVITFGVGYQNSSLDKKLGLERKPVSAQELYDTAIIVGNEVTELIDKVDFPKEGGSSIMPYDLGEMNDKLNDAYVPVAEKYGIVPRLRSRLKYIALSGPMTYTHISGVFCYYTGEANINLNFPDYTIPYTAAHEMAHQRGIAPEDEANFVAFLACVESDDPYIRYCGYQNMLEYLMNALYSADRDLYSKLCAEIHPDSMMEMRAYNAFFEPYRSSAASAVSSAVNDTYLKVLGESEGEKSYGLVVDLAVAYYRGAE